MNKIKAFFAAIGRWFKNVGIGVGKWFKNWFVKVDGKDIIPVRIGRWTKSLFVSVDGKEPGFVTLYKKDGTKSVLASLICILAGILVGFVIMIIVAASVKDIPFPHAFKGLGIIFGGAFSTNGSVAYSVGEMLFKTTPVLLTGLSVAVAFKTGLFNIGAPGQYLMGATGALLIALSIPTTEASAFWVWLLALIVGMLFGMIWGAIPGLFKSLLGVNEVIVCIMTNWIAANVVSWIFNGSRYINIPEGKAAKLFPTRYNGVSTPKLGLDKIFPGSYVDAGIIIAIIIAIIVLIMMTKTKFGFELTACGSNRNGAKYAGMNDKRNIVLSMAIAGGLAACGAALYYLNGNTEFGWNTYSTLPGEGFNGIPVALLASNNPIGVIFSALFLAYLDQGGFNLAGRTGFNEYLADLIVAIIIYFAGFSKLIKSLLSARRKKKLDGNADGGEAKPVVEENITVKEGEQQ